MVLKKLLSNNILLYMLTRYITYILTFIVNMYISIKMGPELFGAWSFLLLVFGYFNIIDIGIPQAVQVLLVQKKSDFNDCADIEKSGLILVLIIALSCFFVALYYAFGGIKKAHELQLDYLFYGICICSFMNYFNNLFEKVYRCKNRLFEIAYKQTSLVLLMAILVLVFNNNILEALVWSYVLWCFSSLLVFLFRGGLVFSGKFSKTFTHQIIKKGINLFLFYSGFVLIMISTKTLVNEYYSLHEFGLFSFAYYLGHAVYLCMLAFATVVITKLIDNYHSTDKKVVLNTISIVRENYVSLFHGAVYAAMILFPVVLSFMPKYSDSLVCMNLCSLMMLCYVNSFGYSTFLMAVNKEKVLAFIAIVSLALNIVLGFMIVVLLHVSYSMVVLSTMISYFVYAYMCTFYGRKALGLNISFISVLIDCFPVSLLIPFMVAIVITFLNVNELLFLPLVLYVVMNIKSIRSSYRTFIKLLNDPKLVNI